MPRLCTLLYIYTQIHVLYYHAAEEQALKGWMIDGVGGLVGD
jgi:hypothetical protein